MGFKNNNSVGGDFGRKCPGQVSPGGGISRRCECVYECLLELLEEAGNNNNNHCCHQDSVSPDSGSNCLNRRCDCQCVFDCLIELIEGAQEEENSCRCWWVCR